MARPQFIVELAFGANPTDANPTWTDVTSDVLSIPSIRRGRTMELGKFEAGTAELTLDNSAGTYTPSNTASPYAPFVRPMTQIRIRALYVVAYGLFRGFVERWTPQWDGGAESTVTLQCVDGFGGILQQRTINYTRSAEYSHWRVQSALDAANWPTFLRSIATSGTSAGQSVIASVALVQTAPLSHLQDVVLSEDGAGYINGDGWYAFQGRHYRATATRSTTVQAVFGDDPLPTTGWLLGTSVLGSSTIPRASGWTSTTVAELPYLSVEPTLDVQYVINDAQVQANGGPVQQASDATSQAQYSIRSKTLNTLLTSDTEAADRAAWMVLQNAQPDIRVPRLTTSGHMNDALWPAILGADISDRVAIVKRPFAGTVLFRECWIEAIEHRNITDATWETTLTLSPATGGVTSTTQPWILESASQGQIDSSFYLGY